MQGGDVSAHELLANATGISPFQRRVYKALLEVPAGKVTTYGALARRIGCASAQAIGQALRRNPFAPLVPCHRVVASDGSLTGFAGHRDSSALARKRSLLEAEGVKLDVMERVESSCFAEW